MKRATVLMTALALCLAAGSVEAQGSKPPNIKEIMGKLNKPTGLYFNLAAELKANDPQWAEMKTQARDVSKLAAALAANEPPKGDKASWAKMAKEYADNAAALEKAVNAQDKTAAKAAHDKMGGNVCMTCHKAHKN